MPPFCAVAASCVPHDWTAVEACSVANQARASRCHGGLRRITSSTSGEALERLKGCSAPNRDSVSRPVACKTKVPCLARSSKEVLPFSSAIGCSSRPARTWLNSCNLDTSHCRDQSLLVNAAQITRKGRHDDGPHLEPPKGGPEHAMEAYPAKRAILRMRGTVNVNVWDSWFSDI